ncbi:hypothetical protein Fbal_1278 [Ferrimonas balearica DSM 9799]|uniref:Uncharacterized protein n=1 Tax=Ferrimonas balearica (strain DSM 9799 / CCM 4581 / KCTC 23876 / PAT) TaxID=550540 RepID=E1SLV5_FERBD|nr:hypothetical protein [Ferrimonas balearica]ADN75487.1 hypothetical protein Fbal_1278 [Ferrimonas balearica DSM 9799]
MYKLNLQRASIITLYIATLFFIVGTGSANAVYRGSTHTETHNITVDASKTTDNYREWFWLDLPAVSCLPNDTFRDCVKEEYSMLRNDLLLWANAAYMLPAASNWNPTWYIKGVGILPLAVYSNDTDEMYLAEFGCSFQHEDNHLHRCMSGRGGIVADVPDHFQHLNRRRVGLRLRFSDFAKLPNGQYTATFNAPFMDWHERFLILNVSVRINVTVMRSDGDDAEEAPVKLHALEGQVLPINFVSLDTENQYGTGSLDFCLEAPDYSNLTIKVVGQDVSYPDSLDSESAYGVRTPGVFVLANRSDSVLDAANAIIRYRIISRTLGLTNSGNEKQYCGELNYGFCSNIPKLYDFSPLPDSPAPGGGTCKRFDISVVTMPYNIYRIQAGDYSSSFYLNVDERP